MANINVTPHDRIEYIMEHSNFGPLVISEPKGWKTDEKTYARIEDEGYDGIFTKFSNKLIFVGDGADYARLVYQTYGPNTELILKRRERHPQTNRWELTYFGYLDLMTYVYQSTGIEIKFNESGLLERVKTRESEKIELERIDTIDGLPLPELPTKNVFIEGRRIFLKSIFTQSQYNNEAIAEVESNAGNTRRQTVALPINVDTNQHQDIAQSPYFQALGTQNVGDIGMMFLLNVDRQRTFKLDISGSLDAYFQQYENVQWCFYGICLTVYENGFNFDLKKRYFIHELRSGRIAAFDLGAATGAISQGVLPQDNDFPLPAFTKQIEFSHNETITLLAGESIAFEAYLGADMYVDNNAGVRVYAQNGVINLQVEEDSIFDPSVTKTVLAHDLGDRLTTIMTSRTDAFYSEALGRTDIGYAQDGVNTGALVGYSHGLWLRGFDKLPEAEDNKYKAFTTSFKEFVEHNKVTQNLSIGIEKVGFKERLRMEEKGFFYNRNVTGHIGYKGPDGKYIYPRVNKFKRSVAEDYYYSSLVFGYEKGADNEEAMGLDEYNTKTTFSTPFTKLKNVFEMVSKYIAGTYPKEFIRRQPKSSYPTTDHQNDREIFCMDLKRGLNDVFEERKYQDDFEEAPTGVFSPETATNLRFSPFNILLKHGWNFTTGLTKEITNYIKYSSSEGNSKLTTKLNGGNAYAENGNIIISELSSPRFIPEWLEFEYPVDFEMIKQVEGSSTILGKTIPNFYGLWQFRNDEGDLEKGFLFNLKPNGKGQWKLLKANA